MYLKLLAALKNNFNWLTIQRRVRNEVQELLAPVVLEQADQNAA